MMIKAKAVLLATIGTVAIAAAGVAMMILTSVAAAVMTSAVIFILLYLAIREVFNNRTKA